MARKKTVEIASLSVDECEEMAKKLGGRLEVREIDGFNWKCCVGIWKYPLSAEKTHVTSTLVTESSAAREALTELAKCAGAYEDGWITEEVPDRQTINIWDASVETCKAIANVYGGEISVAEVDGAKAGLLYPQKKTYLPCWVRYKNGIGFHGCITDSTWNDPVWAYRSALRGFLVSVEAEMKNSEWIVTLPEGVTVDV